MKELRYNTHILWLALCKIVRLSKEPIKDYLFVNLILFGVVTPILYLVLTFYYNGPYFPGIF